jgi:hypothetical protein
MYRTTLPIGCFEDFNINLENFRVRHKGEEERRSRINRSFFKEKDQKRTEKGSTVKVGKNLHTLW